MILNRSMPSSTVTPVLVYEDVSEAVEWLCDAFGFTERWRAGPSRSRSPTSRPRSGAEAQRAPTDRSVPAGPLAQRRRTVCRTAQWSLPRDARM